MTWSRTGDPGFASVNARITSKLSSAFPFGNGAWKMPASVAKTSVRQIT
jgi:hypothetical protein